LQTALIADDNDCKQAQQNKLSKTSSAKQSLLVTFRVPKRRLHYHSFEHFPSAFSARAQEKALSGALLAQASPLCGSGMQLLLPKLLSKLSPRLSKLLVRALLAAIQTRLRSCCISSASFIAFVDCAANTLLCETVYRQQVFILFWLFCCALSVTKCSNQVAVELRGTTLHSSVESQNTSWLL